MNRKNLIKDNLLAILKLCSSDNNISIKTYYKILGNILDVLSIIDKEYLEKGE